MEYVIVEMQCFRNENNEFIVKELTILKEKGEAENFLFCPPYPKEELSSKIQRVNAYCTRKIHGFEWEEGRTDYSALGLILTSRCRNCKIIITKGSEKKKFLEKILDQKILDADEFIPGKYEDISTPAEFPGCPFHQGIHEMNCSGKNAWKIHRWLQNS